MIDDIRQKLTRFQAQYELAAQTVRDERATLYKAEDRVVAAQQAQEIIQVVGKRIQEKVHDRISDIVTHCLKTVFGKNAYEFRLVFETKRGKTECRPVFIRDGNEVHPLRGGGGGAADVASFALRLACMVLSDVRRVLILDEPFKWLSAHYTERARELLEELSDKMSMQFIVVTHNEELRTGKIVYLSVPDPDEGLPVEGEGGGRRRPPD